MAEYRTLRMSFWNDPYVEQLGPEGRLLYLYLITCPHTNSLGVLEVSTRRVSYETGLAPEVVEELLAEAERAGKLVKDGTVLWLVNFVRHQASTSPRLVQSLRGLWRRLSSERIREAALRRYPELLAERDTVGDGADTVSGAVSTLGAGSIKEEEEGEQEETRKRAGRFRPPDESEVRAYCEARRNGISAEAFVNFYASKGWKVGSSPMRDWRAAVRTWETKRREGVPAVRTASREARNEEAARRALERFEGAAAFRREERQ